MLCILCFLYIIKVIYYIYPPTVYFIEFFIEKHFCRIVILFISKYLNTSWTTDQIPPFVCEQQFFHHFFETRVDMPVTNFMKF